MSRGVISSRSILSRHIGFSCLIRSRQRLLRKKLGRQLQQGDTRGQDAFAKFGFPLSDWHTDPLTVIPLLLSILRRCVTGDIMPSTPVMMPSIRSSATWRRASIQEKKSISRSGTISSYILYRTNTLHFQWRSFQYKIQWCNGRT